METKDYLVTELAGPKVAGVVTQPGAVLSLTDEQARGELLAGAIVPKGKHKDGPKASEVFRTTKKLADIQARATGKDGARAPDAPPAEIKQGGAPDKAPAAPLAAETASPAGGLGADASTAG